MEQVLSWGLLIVFYGGLEWFFRMRLNGRHGILKSGRLGSKTVSIIGAFVATAVFVMVRSFGDNLVASAYTFAVLIFVIRSLSELNTQRVLKRDYK